MATGSGARNFCLGEPSCGTNIFIKTTLTYIHTYIYVYTHVFYLFIIYIHIYIYTLFYLISYMYTHTQQKKKKKSLVSSIKIVAVRYPLNSSIWDPINLYVSYILILSVWPQASLGSCLNKTLLSSVPLLFPSLHSCVSQFPSISLSPFIFFPTNLYNVHLLLIL